jgi:hypothetical protein
MIAAGIVSDPVWVKRSGFVTGTMASIVTILKPKSKAEAYIRALRHVRPSNQELEYLVKNADEDGPAISEATTRANKAVANAENLYFKELI